MDDRDLDDPKLWDVIDSPAGLLDTMRRRMRMWREADLHGYSVKSRRRMWGEADLHGYSVKSRRRMWREAEEGFSSVNRSPRFGVVKILHDSKSRDFCDLRAGVV
ncbi:hypothetical protein KSP39_PZI002470 [Platanthera zijinensis]|uniref:Uncharacterized protein n=1 Tax=Platanthera zijinensis TaxID=2320716 RepID=A0AAP0C122_9ASPA